MTNLLPERKISHRIWEELGADPEDIKKGLTGGFGFAAPAGIAPSRKPVILRKADPFPVTTLLEKLLEKISEEHVSGHTDFFIFAGLTAEELREVEAYKEVDRIFLDEPLTAYLDRAVETTKAKASWNTFDHYGDGTTWAVLDSGINDLHPHFGGGKYTQRGQFPPWWQPQTIIQRDWFKQIKGSTFQIEPGYPDNSVVMRVHLVQGGNLHPHGTHIAGIIAGKQPDNMPEARVGIPGTQKLETVSGVKGLAPRAQIVDFRVLDGAAKGLASDAITALFFIRKINEEAGRTVIGGANLSLGYPYNPWDFGCGGSPLCEEVDRLVYSGVLVVVAAGNSGYAEFPTTQFSDTGQRSPAPQALFNFQSITDPGNAREAITVGSTHRLYPHRWGPSFFSSKGPTGDGRLKPDLLAPGEKITSCDVNFDDQSSPPRLYLQLSGTSQAAAMVSGGLALFLSVHPEFVGRPLEVKEKLLTCCTNLNRDSCHQGSGLLDIFRLSQSV
jgi:subtilisin family serine protease